MALSGLKGSFPLTGEEIDKEVKHIASGVFSLGNLQEGKYRTVYVGRADTNLNKQLKQRIGQATRFKYGRYNDLQDAFNKECELFHFLKPKGNKIHPQCPPSKNWPCLDCGYSK